MTIRIRLHINKMTAALVTRVLAEFALQSRTEAVVHAVQIGLVAPASG